MSYEKPSRKMRGLTVLGVVAFAAACMTVAPVPHLLILLAVAETVDRLRNGVPTVVRRLDSFGARTATFAISIPKLAPWSRTSA